MTTVQAKKLATVESVLRTGHTNSEGQHPVRIRVTYERKSRYYPVDFQGKRLYLTLADWNELYRVDEKTGKPIKHRGARKEMKEAIEDTAKNARDAIKRISQRAFTFDRFEKEYLHQESERGILGLFEKYLRDLEDQSRTGGFLSYRDAYRAFNKFRGGKTETKKQKFVRGKEIKPEDLTIEVVKKFDTWLKKQGCNQTTVAIYMRGLRTIFNVAADSNPALAEFYPFSRKSNDNKRYRIRTGSGKKGQAMDAADLQKFIATTPKEGDPMWEAKQYWLFMFYASGMNMADVAQLQYRNIDLGGKAIRYVRAKTRETEAKEEVIEIPLSAALSKIIVAIGNKGKLPADYVFPILTKGMNPMEIKSVTKQKTKIINKWLARLCRAHDLPPITTYWARHTAASLLKESGVPIEMISELLGHSDVKVTREYLKRFSIQKKSDAIAGAMAVLKTG